MKTKVLFVCMGNICRSPTAEGSFRSIVSKQSLSESFEIDSAGTHAYHIGNPPDSRSQQTARKYGVDLSNQRARKVHESDFYYYDHIIAMDTDNIEILKSICPTVTVNLKLNCCLIIFPMLALKVCQIHILKENLMKCLRLFMNPALLFWKA